MKVASSYRSQAGCLVVATALFTVNVRSQEVSGKMDNTPYAGIVARNVFGLLPIPVHKPEDDAPPVDPPPKITPNGIMTIFGRDQALFKVAEKPKPGQPAKEVSHVLAEGEMEDEITVVKINHVDGIITFNNHGTVQELPLVAAKETASGPPPGVPPPRNPLLPGGMPPPAGTGVQRQIPRPMGSGPGYSPQAGTGSGMGGLPIQTVGSQQAQANDPNAVTPEQAVYLIEAQRMKYLREGSPIANLLPPTPLTDQNVRENTRTTPPPP